MIRARYNKQGDVQFVSPNVPVELLKDENGNILPFIEVTENPFIKAKINLETLEIYEGATAEEILEYENKKKVCKN